jgi:hypothetical protein
MLVLFALAFWVGGFFFYAGVVIHVGRDVLGGHRLQGFVTQQVTIWLNVASLPALAIFLWNALASRPGGSSRRLWRALLGTWCLMALIQLLLFWLHPVMSRFLDLPAKQIAFRKDFRQFHNVYMALSAVQHFAAALYLLLSMVLWRRSDMMAGSGSTEIDMACPSPRLAPASEPPPEIPIPADVGFRES